MTEDPFMVECTICHTTFALDEIALASHKMGMGLCPNNCDSPNKGKENVVKKKLPQSY